MPELKRTAQAGIMNRDLDDRMVQPGTTRIAVNCAISRSEGSDIGTVETILGNIKIENSDIIEDAKCIGAVRDNSLERIYFFLTDNNDNYQRNLAGAKHAIYEFDQTTHIVSKLVEGNWLNFHQDFLITGVNFIDGLLFWTDDRGEPRKINVETARADSSYYTEFNSTVIKLHPWRAPEVDNKTSGDDYKSKYLENRIPRFAYRYKFEDNEYSPISLWSNIAFETDTTVTLSAISNGYVEGFRNQVVGVDLTAHVLQGYGITSVEFLYTDQSTPNVYIIGEEEVGSNNEITFKYYGEEPFRALPEGQTTRIYDAVPRRAKSQEFAGGRLIYGNYTRHFDLPTLDYTVSLGSNNVTNPQLSLKTRRNYEVGIILSDEFGRQTPVLLADGATIYAEPSTTNNVHKLQVTFNSVDLPEWAKYYRVVVKPDKGEYYNWFYQYSGTDNKIEIEGRNLNKVPRDLTEQGNFSGSTIIYPTNVKVWETVDNSGLTGDNTIRSVIQIEEDNTGQRALMDFTPSAHGVLEVVPDDSVLDVFYETATGGPVADLAGGLIEIDFYNCYVSSNIEFNRIEGDFNAPFFDYGIKAYLPLDDFQEETRPSSIIHSSGLFNNRVGANGSNDFNDAEGGITISVDPSDGSIQKLFAEDTQLLIFQEDKVSRSPIDKSFIYGAEGGAIPVTTTTQFLGTIAPYSGEYGISRDPASFAVYGTRKYFTDKSRGVVLRLSQNGIQEISQNGMIDFFRDALFRSSQIIGSFDEYHEAYHVTLVGTASYTAFEDTNIATASDGYFTLSYEDYVQGWNSFKTFQQEAGITLNNIFYTFNNGDLWEHNNVSARYNEFYGQVGGSQVEFIFNDAPSDVKEFKTIGYEGDAGWECDYVQTDYDVYLREGVSALEAEDFILVTPVVGYAPDDTIPTIIIAGTERQVVSLLPEESSIDEVEFLYWYVRLSAPGTGDLETLAPELRVELDTTDIIGEIESAGFIDGDYWFTIKAETPQTDLDFDITIYNSPE